MMKGLPDDIVGWILKTWEGSSKIANTQKEGFLSNAIYINMFFTPFNKSWYQ